MTPRPNLS